MQRKSRIGIKDIAEEAGVSISTVSKVLNNKIEGVRIRDETRKRVVDIAERLGYQPNPMASALRSNRTGIIGAVNRNMGGGFLSRLALQVQLAAQQKEIELFVTTMKDETNHVKAQLSILQGQLFDGFLLIGDLPNYRDLARRLKRLNKPYVSVAAGINVETPMIHTDEAKGIKFLLDYLTALGHTKIAFMGSLAWPLVLERLNMFHADMQARGLQVPARYVSDMGQLDYSPNDRTWPERDHRMAIRYAQLLMQQPDPPTAIFCATDGFAIGALKAAYHLGLNVPRDISIASFDGGYEAFMCQPELTTVRRPMEDVALAAIELLLALIENPEDETLQKRILIEPKLIVRSSCAAPSL